MKAKKLISMLLCLMMILSVIPFSASAASSFFFEDFEGNVAPVWETIGNSSIIGSTGAWANVTVGSEAGGNKYLHTEVINGSGNRGMLREFPAYDTRTATVSFDWNPAAISAVPNTAEMRFYSESSTAGFMLGLVWTAGGKIGYHTSNISYGRTDVVGTANCPSTGLDINNWYKVTVNFDFEAHTVGFSMVGRDDPSLTFSVEDLAIGQSHKKFATLIWYGVKGSGGGNINATSLIDNFKIDVNEYAANEILSITQPAAQIVAAGDSVSYPTSVEALLGDGSTATVPIGEWTSEPAFDANVYGTYTFTAPLVLGETYANSRNISASFRVTTSAIYAIEKVLNPTSIKVDYVAGQAMPALPTTVTAKLNNGTWVQAPVSEWTATRAFDANAEGTYTYNAYVQGVEGQFSVSSATAFRVTQYILSYSMGDNFNGYTRSMEWLDRGVVALKSDDGIFVSWRLLASEYGKDIKFNVYKNNVKLNAEPITTKTNYLDAAGKPGDVYAVETIFGGQSVMSEGFAALEHNYLAIPIQKPDDQPNVLNSQMASYTANDAACADVDGDGEYEIVVKWYPSNQIDSGSAALTSPTFFDCYKLDGTVLWRIDMGYNITSGAHYSMFMFYDFDQDGKAEFLIKCADGTTVYAPNKDGIIDMDDESTIIDYVGDPSLDGVNCIPSGTGVGHIRGGNEYFAAFEGLTGKIIDVTNYQFPIGSVNSWGDGSYNRSDRYNAGIGYIPNPNSDDPSDIVPAAYMNRGYYARTSVCAYILQNDKLQNVWNFDSATYTASNVGGKGNHNTVTGDVDGDGYDEYVLGGAIALDHDGTLLWAKDGRNGLDNLAHGDVIHMAKMFPNNERFYIWTAYESGNSVVNSSLTDAASGGRAFGEKYGNVDAGRGCAANITPNPGFEVWSQRPGNETPNQRPQGSLYNVYGEMIAEVKGINFPCNWRAYWDGDLLSELPDGQYIGAGNGDTPQAIYKYNWVTNEMDVLDVFDDTLTNNGTKNTPNLAADLFGDWREEICARSTDSSELRIYSTTIPTEYMIYTLMHDPGYRLTVGNQNCCYNQPPHLSYYLGEDIAETVLAMDLPVAPMYYTNDPNGISAKADKTFYAIDETITVTVKAPSDIAKVYLANEAGNGLASGRSSVVDGDMTTWTLTLALGTVGERTLSVYADGVDTGLTVSFEIGYPEASGTPEVLSVMPPLSINANEAFTLTITTNAYAQNVRLFNENGAGLMPSACTYVENDGSRVWSYTLAVGTSGQRNFVAKAAAEDNVYVSDTLVSLYVG